MTEPTPRAHLLPGDATPAERAVAQVDGRFDDIDTGLVVAVLDPATCPAALLPYLAWSRSVDTWDTTWPESIKRAVIAAAPTVHRYKGTRRSIEAVLGALGMRTKIVEWWQASPKAAPYTFQVTAFATLRYVRAGPLITRELTQAALSAVRASSPLSRAFEFRIGVEIRAPIAAAVAGSAYNLTTPSVRARPYKHMRAGATAAGAATAFGLTTPSVRARPATGIAGRLTGTIAGRSFALTTVRSGAGALTAMGAATGAAAAGRVVAVTTPRMAARPHKHTAARAAAAAAGRAVLVITARMEAKP